MRSSWSDDQPGAASIGQPFTGPFEEYGNSAPETDQEENVGKSPHQPTDKTGDPDEAEIHRRRRTTDDRKRTRIAVAECRGRSISVEPTTDHARDIGTLLLRDWRHQRQRLSAMVIHRSDVANHKDIPGELTRGSIETIPATTQTKNTRVFLADSSRHETSYQAKHCRQIK